MSEGFTETTANKPRRDDGPAWERNTYVTDYTEFLYRPNIEEAGNMAVVAGVSRRETRQNRNLRRSKETASELATRDAVRRAVGRAIVCTDRMTEAARIGDAMELSNAGFDLLNVLDELWTLRANREPNWRDLLNLLQGALSREHFEAYTTEKCVAINDVVSSHLKAWTVENDDIRSSISILRQAGLDPWKGISAPSER